LNGHLFLGLTSLALAGAGCGDDCGPHGAPDDGLAVTGSGVMFTYSGLYGSPNMDCPDPNGPSNVVSLTIMGSQTNSGVCGSGGNCFTLCIPRPDKLGDKALTFPTDARLIDLTGSDAACSYTLDGTQPASGGVTAAHICSDGTDAAGFAMTVDATAVLRRTCGTTIDTVAITLAGTTAVAGPM